MVELFKLIIIQLLYFKFSLLSTGGGGGGGGVAQSEERATPGEEVPGLVPYLLGRCQYNATG